MCSHRSRHTIGLGFTYLLEGPKPDRSSSGKDSVSLSSRLPQECWTMALAPRQSEGHTPDDLSVVSASTPHAVQPLVGDSDGLRGVPRLLARYIEGV